MVYLAKIYQYHNLQLHLLQRWLLSLPSLTVQAVLMAFQADLTERQLSWATNSYTSRWWAFLKSPLLELDMFDEGREMGLWADHRWCWVSRSQAASFHSQKLWSWGKHSKLLCPPWASPQERFMHASSEVDSSVRAINDHCSSQQSSAIGAHQGYMCPQRLCFLSFHTAHPIWLYLLGQVLM